MNLVTKSADGTHAFGAALGEMLRAGDVVVLSGDLGAGKTTLTQGVARGLGVVDPVTSPTFTLVNEYEAKVPILHVDVYRLDRVQEVHEIGLDEMLEEAVTIIEWGERVAQVLPPDRLVVRLGFAADANAYPEARTMELQPHGPAWNDRRAALAALVDAHDQAR